MPAPQQRPTLEGSIRLFAVAGITVYVHWSWLLVGFFILQFRASEYRFFGWNVAEYLSLFVLVLLHEFGHALACRQVGGRANEIVLWPLGGIAFVDPPPRPGALLWSIVAGPLVNLVLMPITIGAWAVAYSQGLNEINRDAGHFVFAIAVMNALLFALNMLPIYPLDGGQILQALLWFVVGRAKSLLVVSVVGLVAAIAIFGAALAYQEWWFVVLSVFAGLRCIAGFKQAQLLARLENAPRHRDARCPGCGVHPLIGPFWKCHNCPRPFDTFDYQAECPDCGEQFATTTCPECGAAHPIGAWYDEWR